MDQKAPSFQTDWVGLAHVTRRPNISMSAKAVLWDLICYAGSNGNAFPSKKTLAKDMGCSERHISNILNELRVAGLITWVKGKSGKSNRYKLTEQVYKMRKPASVSKGNRFHPHTGTWVPPNTETESSNSIYKNSIKWEGFTSCGNCDTKGMLVGADGVTECSCRQEYRRRSVGDYNAAS